MSNVPLLIQGVGLVLIALLIPIWISVFRGEKRFEDLDEKILIDYILEGKALLVFLGLIFIPPLLWEIPYLGLKFLIVLLSGISIICMFRNISRALIWISGEKFKLRFDFLKELEGSKINSKIWRSVWKAKGIEYVYEGKFLEIFFSKGGCTQKLYHFEMFFCGLQGFFLTLSSLLIQDSFSSFDILSLI